jgi:hypothetical protein
VGAISDEHEGAAQKGVARREEHKMRSVSSLLVVILSFGEIVR